MFKMRQSFFQMTRAIVFALALITIVSISGGGILHGMVLAESRSIYVGDQIVLDVMKNQVSRDEIVEIFEAFEMVEFVELDKVYRLTLRTMTPGSYEVTVGNQKVLIEVKSLLEEIDRDDIFEGGDMTPPPKRLPIWPARLVMFASGLVFLIAAILWIIKVAFKKKRKEVKAIDLFYQSLESMSLGDALALGGMSIAYKTYLSKELKLNLVGGATSSELVAHMSQIFSEELTGQMEEWFHQCDVMNYKGHFQEGNKNNQDVVEINNSMLKSLKALAGQANTILEVDKQKELSEIDEDERL